MRLWELLHSDLIQGHRYTARVVVLTIWAMALCQFVVKS